MPDVQYDWWGRRPLWLRILLIAAVVGTLGIAAALIGGEDSGSNGGANPPAASPQPEPSPEPEPEPEQEPPPPPDNSGPVLRGTFNDECNQFSAGDLEACQKLVASNVTCQWVEDNVVMKVRFRNPLDAHVTVHVNPTYRLKNAGTHGEGITNVEDVGLDPGEVRNWETELDPAGIEDNQPAITACTPGVDVLSGVELG